MSTGCGSSSSSSTGWKAKTVTGKTGKTGLSERSASQLEKAKTNKGGRTSVSTGCGSSAPSTPIKAPKPAKPQPAPTRTGC